MTWFFLAVASAILLGFYDVFKKQSLRDNAVIPVLLINTALSSLLFLPLLSGSQLSWISPNSRWYIPPAPLTHHLFVMGKAVIVLSSWVCGYFAIKHLPLTLVGPINATRPVMTLMGAVHLPRTIQRLAVGRCALGHLLLLSPQPQRPQRRDPLFAQPLHPAAYSCRCARCLQWFVR